MFRTGLNPIKVLYPIGFGLIVFLAYIQTIVSVRLSDLLFTPAAFAGAYILAVVPVSFLLSIALSVAVFLPIAYLDFAYPIGALGITSVVLLAWILRIGVARLELRRLGLPEWLLVGLSILFVGGIFYSTARQTSLFWSIAFSLFVVSIVLFGRYDQVGLALVKKTWCALAVVISAFGALEMALGMNPIYGSIFDGSASNRLTQDWSTYRITTSLGHPLLNATFLSIAAVLHFQTILRHGYSLNRVAGLAVCCTGAVLTGSRSGLLALTAGLLLTALSARSAPITGRVAYCGLLAFAAVAASIQSDNLFNGRFSSAEAMRSSEARNTFLEQGLLAVNSRPWVGYGPSALAEPAAHFLHRASGNFENSWLELAIGSGLIAPLLLVCVVLLLVFRAASDGNPLGGVGAVATYSVCMASFNILFGYPNWMLLLGIVLALCVSDRRELGLDSATSRFDHGPYSPLNATGVVK